MTIAPTTTNNASTTTNTSSSSTDALAAAGENYQDFLKLLTTQLQNQDPTAPADTNQLTQQIATLSQVEQQINTNQNLEKLLAAYNSSNLSTTAGYIGKTIEAPGNNAIVENGKADMVYTLASSAASSTINISDSTGKIVRTIPGTTASGRNELTWDGKDSTGNQLPDGDYTYTVTATDSAGANVAATTYMVGTVDSVNSANGASSLMVGDISVALTDVSAVRGGASSADVSYLGKQVEAAGNQGMLASGVASFLYTLDSAATNATITISDAKGNVVTTAAGTTLAGRNQVFWNGEDSNGNPMEDGIYTIKVAATDAQGNPINATTYTVGIVSSVDVKNGKTVLSMGDIQLGVDQVLSVRDPATIGAGPSTDTGTGTGTSS